MVSLLWTEKAGLSNWWIITPVFTGRQADILGGYPSGLHEIRHWRPGQRLWTRGHLESAAGALGQGGMRCGCPEDAVPDGSAPGLCQLRPMVAERAKSGLRL